MLLSTLISCGKEDPGNGEEKEKSNALIAHWAFDGNGIDSSGNGHVATLHNLSPAADRFGDPKGAYYFNGVNSFAIVEDKPDLRLNNSDFTLTAWVRLDTYGANILSKRIAGVNNGWQSSVTGTPNNLVGVLSYGPGGGSNNAWGSKVVGKGDWHLLVSVFNQESGTLSIFIDGVLDNTTSGILTPNKTISAALFIGKDEPTNSHLKGAMDDVRIYGRAFSNKEVEQFYDITKRPSNDLIAHWAFDGNGEDSSGNNHDATLFNLSPAVDRLCNPRGALYFNGVNGYATVADKLSLRLTGIDFTLNTWVKMDAYNASYGSNILSKHITGLNNGWGWSVCGYASPATGPLFYGPGGGSTNAVGVAVINLNEWHMLTSVYKVSTGQMFHYIDGSLDNVSNNILTPNAAISATLYIGKDEPTNMYYYKGILDDIRIYGRALTKEEIDEFYKHTKGGCGEEEDVEY